MKRFLIAAIGFVLISLVQRCNCRLQHCSLIAVDRSQRSAGQIISCSTWISVPLIPTLFRPFGYEIRIASSKLPAHC